MKQNKLFIKKINCIFAIIAMAFSFNCYSQYTYYPSGGGTISGANTLLVGQSTTLTVTFPTCFTGVSNPKNATNFPISWNINTINSNVGGTFVSGGNETTGTNATGTSTLNIGGLAPGTYYYYVVVNNANPSVCSGANSMVSTTFRLDVVQPATHLNFDGVDDLVDLGTSLNTILDPLNTLTVEAWVKPTTSSGFGVIIGNYSNPNSEMQFLLRRDGSDYTFWIQGTGGFKNVSANNSVVLNTWQHIAGVWNGSDLKIYVDGVLVATTTGVNDSSFATTANKVIIGNNEFLANPEEFTGSIDEVRIWNTSLSADDIARRKNCELQGTETGLVAYYKFNQGIGSAANPTVTSLTNSVSGGITGTLTNFALTGTTSNWLAGSPVTTGSMIPNAATVTTPVTYNQGATATALTATTGGTGLLWYTTATGGTGTATAPTPSTATAGNTSYWVASTNANGCESVRTEIVVTVNAKATHLNFDGVDDNVSSSATGFPSVNTARTISAWVKTSQNNAGGCILSYGNNTTNNRFGLYQTGGKLNFVGQGNDYNTNVTINDNVWHHVAATFDGTSLKVYVDGAQVGTTQARTFNTTGTSFSIGNQTVQGEFFQGSIDEVRVWNYALTASDIMNTRNCEAQAQSQLVAYYKFNQGFNNVSNAGVTTLTNSGSGGANGTLTNFALTGATSNWASGSPIVTGTTCTTLGTSSFDVSSTLKIYPNPATSNINIDFQDLENASVEVSDINGRVLVTQKLNNTSNNVNIEKLTSGMYLFKVSSSQGVATSKIIKK